MTNVTYGHTVASLSDLKVTNIGGTTQEDLDVAMELTFTPEIREHKWVGDDRNKAYASTLLGGRATISSGAISSAALAIITGQSLSTTSTSPTEVTELQLDAGTRFPYFKVYGVAPDEGTGDLQVLLYKVKLASGLEFSLKDGELVTPGFEVEVLDDGTHGVFELIQHETATAVPAS